MYCLDEKELKELLELLKETRRQLNCSKVRSKDITEVEKRLISIINKFEQVL